MTAKRFVSQTSEPWRSWKRRSFTTASSLGELAKELPAASVQVKGALEVAFAGEPPRLVREEQLAHAREVDRRADVVEMFLLREVHPAADVRFGAVGGQIDVREPHPTGRRSGNRVRIFADIGWNF